MSEDSQISLEQQQLINNILEEWESNPMIPPRLSKVVVNFSVGKSGPELEKARMLCEKLTDQTPVDCLSKQTVRGFNIRKGEPIGVRVTLRGSKAEDFLKKAFWAKDEKLSMKSLDKQGNLALGISEHLDLPEVRYDPQIGVLGFDVTCVLERPGMRVTRRRRRKNKIKKPIRKEEGMVFFTTRFGTRFE